MLLISIHFENCEVIPERRTPFSPTKVWNPFGKFLIKVAALAISATFSISSVVTVEGSAAPYAMFSAIEQENRTGS